LLGQLRISQAPAEPSIVLNKRSRLVKQPGDLCCPGGGVSRSLDPWLARALEFPGMPLRRWPHYRDWRAGAGDRALPLMFAAALREAFEEMRLLPLNARFLGLLPPQPLYLRGRAIRPAVAWMPRRQRFRPNWEVDRIVVVPLRQLLDGSRYARLRVSFEMVSDPQPSSPREFPCFRFHDNDGEELLWGATYRIVAKFLELAFGFTEPALDSLPERRLTLNDAYLAGSRGAR